MSGLRVLVCGGRNFTDFELLTETLDRLKRERGVRILISGGARGADGLAESWAELWDVETDIYLPYWHRDGKAAGPIRNQRMIDEGKPDLVVAFPGGRGTADMVRRARAAGIDVVEVRS